MRRYATFTEAIKAEDASLGTLFTLPNMSCAEILALAGFDWLFLDMEHGPLSVAEVQQITQVVQAHCYTAVRVPENSSVWIKRVLDVGCDGIIVPQVNSAEEARSAIHASKYPPLGYRSVGISRAHKYGSAFSDYVSSANSSTAVILQIEHIEAVKNIDEILEVEGIDGIFIGPYDLSGSMNMLGQVGHPDVQEAIDTVKKRCAEYKIPLGGFVMKPEGVSKEVNDGCSFVAVGIDTVLFANAAKDVINKSGLK